MRPSASVLALVLLGSGLAAADPLWSAEVRMGYGVALANGDGMTAARKAPLTLEGLAAYAIDVEPSVYAFGGFRVETLDRSSMGGTAGVMLQQGAIRLRAGGALTIAPYSLWGGVASGGVCKHVGHGAMRGCGDLEVTEYFGGSDLAMGHAVTQIQLVLGVVFDDK